MKICVLCFLALLGALLSVRLCYPETQRPSGPRELGWQGRPGVAHLQSNYMQLLPKFITQFRKTRSTMWRGCVYV